MTIDFKPQTLDEAKPRITVFGVGGAGGNAVNNMINGQLEGVDFVVANTDSQSLLQSLAEHRVQLGMNITNGLGAGARPDIGKVAAEEALDDIQRYLDGNNMVFIAAGMGGGTGTGAAPVIARAAREQGILTVGVVTKPFQFEGLQRMNLADSGIQELQSYVDTLIVIPNQNLFRIANEHTGFAEAFKLADDVLHAGVRGVTDLMINPGLINLDFADIRTVMGEMGKAMMGTGEAEGDTRAVESAEAAINNPLLDNASIEGAQGVLINITGGADMTLHEVDEAAMRICREVDEHANIIFGTSIDDNLEGSMRVAVIATGIDADTAREPIPLVPDNVHVLGVPSNKSSSSGATAENDHEGIVSSSEETTETSDDGPDKIIENEGSTNQFMSDTVHPNTNDETITKPEEQSQANEPAEVPKAKSVSASVGGGIAAGVKISPKTIITTNPLSSDKLKANQEMDKEASFIPPPAVDPGQPSQKPSNKSVDIISEADLINAGRKPKKKSASLFERMTGTGRARQLSEELEQGTKSKSLANKAQETPKPPLSNTTKSSPEPKLDVGNQASSSGSVSDLSLNEGDPLEIPAFLRRQAN